MLKAMWSNSLHGIFVRKQNLHFRGNKFHTYVCLARNPNPESKGVIIY